MGSEKGSGLKRGRESFHDPKKTRLSVRADFEKSPRATRSFAPAPRKSPRSSVG